jgi:hypothetical protein
MKYFKVVGVISSLSYEKTRLKGGKHIENNR